MTTVWKKIAFAALVIACIVATALLFTSGKDTAEPSTVPTLTIPRTESGDATREPDAAKMLAEWNTYHGGNTLRGFAEATLSTELTAQWTILSGAPVRQPPVVHNGTVFAVTARGVVIAASLEGQEIWRRDLNAPEPGGEARVAFRIEAPITAVAGKVFVSTDMGDVFALRADTGEKLWYADIGGPVRGAPNYSDDGGRVFVLDQDEGALVCLDADSGTTLWRSTGVDRSDGSPAISDSIAVFGSCASAIHIVSTATGERLRDISIENGGGQIAGGIALANGFAYAGVRDGRILCADIEAGTLVWTTEISEAEVFATPAIRGEWVIATSYDGLVHALNRSDGKIRWRHDVEGMPSSPIIAGNKVLVTADGVLFVLRLDDGARLGEVRVADEISGPAISSTMIFVGGEDGVITAYGGTS